jgi:YfiH family protein
MDDAVTLLQVVKFPARHGFATRVGGVSNGSFASLNIGADNGDDPKNVADNQQRVMAAFGHPGELPVTVKQVHGARVVHAAEAGLNVEADAVVSDRPGDVLAVQTADCLPLLLVDADGRATAAVHAGWRGTVAGVVGATIAALRDRFGVPSTDLHAVIGPHVRAAAYQVGPEVVQAFRQAAYPLSVAQADAQGRYRLSVAAAVRHDLALAGVPFHHVYDVGGCTLSEPERFFSHRRDGATTGRQWALVEVPTR